MGSAVGSEDATKVSQSINVNGKGESVNPGAFPDWDFVRAVLDRRYRRHREAEVPFLRDTPTSDGHHRLWTLGLSSPESRLVSGRSAVSQLPTS